MRNNLKQIFYIGLNNESFENIFRVAGIDFDLSDSIILASICLRLFNDLESIGSVTNDCFDLVDDEDFDE